MRLTRLDIAGFKSFAKKTELQFGSGVTAVIGPNGSGKSNISDAVRWVLGEQSAKALRGAKMEDVIFNGTQTRRPQSMCEVTLTFDNSDHKLPTDYHEVAVTRRMFRSGESEYCLNGHNCRLKDVLDLFRDTGIGKDGYSIISQGKVDEILSNKSNDRRTALEEAAGVMRYRVRKEEAERKLDGTEKNMERIADVLKELGERIEPLKLQSAAARTFLQLREELKDLEVNLFLYQADRQQERLAALKDAIQQLESDLTLNEANDKTLASQSTELEGDVRALDAQATEQQNRVIEMLSGVETHVGESNLLVERRAHAKQEIARVTAERASFDAQCTALIEAQNALKDGGANDDKRQALQAELTEAATALDALDGEIAAREQAVDAQKTAMMEAMNRLADAKSDLTRFDTMTASLKERLGALDDEESEAAQKRDALLLEAETAQTERAAVQAQLDAHTAARKAAQHNRIELETEYLARQAELRLAEQNVGALSSREHVLREMVRSHEGYQNSVRGLLQAAERDERLNRCIVGPVAELLHVPQQYETAIGMSLGGALQNVVTETAEDAKTVIEYARSHDLGRVTLLPIAFLHTNPLSPKERELLSADGVVGLASELIDYAPAMQTVAEYLLGRTVVVADLDSAVALRKRSRNAFHIATLLGDFLSTGGTMTGGSLKKQSFSLLGREREVQEISAQRKKAEAALTQKTEQVEALKKQILLADTQIDAFVGETHADELALVKQDEKCEIIARDIRDANERCTALADERGDLSESMQTLTARRDASQSVQTDIEQQNLASREDIRMAQQALQAQKQDREARAAALTDQRVRAMALQKEAEQRAAEQARLAREWTQNASKRDGCDETLLRLAHTVSEADARLSEMEQSISGEQDALQLAKEAQQKTEQERARVNDLLIQYRHERDALAENYRMLGERKHKQEMAQSRIEMENRQLADHIWDEYTLTYENALPLRREVPIGTTNARIAALKTEIRALGDVNVSAIEDYRIVTERFDALTAQYTDLEQAKTDLYTLIGQLTHTMERVFLEEFQKVQANFTNVFEQLFGGGHAELRLQDKNDVLNCDVDIIAQPPGKKLQLLSLLSGGERALTAIALLFAMLQLKAPAFCVLDEIETSLDEENVAKFANYVKQYANETQFILITHRKGSMEVCDTLYGVAMEEKGVSSIVSAKFGESA